MATIRDVANLAGVSTTTVSYALNKPDRVTDELRLRVEEAVRALNYRPDGPARALRTGHSHLVSLVVPDVATHFYAAMARGVADTIKSRGLHVVVGSTDAEAAEEVYFLEESALQRAAGIIVVPFRLTPDQVLDACGRDVPIVVIGPRVGNVEIASIAHDDTGGVQQVVEHLLRQGRRRIAFISGLTDTPASDRRHAGYLAAHEHFRIPIDQRLHVTGDFKRTGGEQAMLELLATGVDFDAVSAANDLMAIGAMRVLRRRGIRIPQDVAVVGYDDIDEAEIVEPALTTVRQPAYEAGQLAAELLLKHIDGAPQVHTHISIPTTLVVRESG